MHTPSNWTYRLIALCARAECDADRYRQIAQVAEQLTEWNVVPAEAEAHGMAPLLYRHLVTAGATLSPPVKRELQSLFVRHRLQQIPNSFTVRRSKMP